MAIPMLKRPSAFVPVAMSAVALAIVIGYAVLFGTARQADEGAEAGVAGAGPAGRRGARRDVPGLVVSVVVACVYR